MPDLGRVVDDVDLGGVGVELPLNPFHPLGERGEALERGAGRTLECVGSKVGPGL